MTSSSNEDFLHYDWSTLDETAWQQLLQEMSTGDYTVDTTHSQGWHLGFPSDSEDRQGLDNPQTLHSSDVNAGHQAENLVSPPSYQRLLSAEASPETEPVPQAEACGDELVLVEELRGLVDHLQREYVPAFRAFLSTLIRNLLDVKSSSGMTAARYMLVSIGITLASRKLERINEYIEELQPWTLHINNLVYELMAKIDPPMDAGPEALGREREHSVAASTWR